MKIQQSLEQKINILKQNKGTSLNELTKKLGYNKLYFYDTMSNIRKRLPNITEEEQEFLDLYSEYTSDSFSKIETDDRAVTGVERNKEGHVEYYTFEIYRKNNPTLRGKLSRTEMETIYSLYSIYGANLTQKIVSREFPQYTFIEFRRILRAFNVYKSDSPFPLHMLEERSEEELEILHIKAKENNLLRKLEKNELRDTKKLVEKLYKENKELALKSGKFEFEITNEVTPIYSPEYVKSDKDLIIFLSDLHIGACLESGALYENNWNEQELERRLVSLISNINKFGKLNNLIICLLGDSLDGMDRMTARKDHIMPQNMDNREQFNVFLRQMIKFIGRSIGLANKISIYSVPCGNHDGDAGYMAHSALKYAVNAKFPEINFELFEKFFGTFSIKDNNYCICHGKDKAAMRSPLPKNLNDRTEAWLKDFMLLNNIPLGTHFVKGDLHSESFEATKCFDYRNVLSLFGASDYCQYNYTLNNYGVSYDLYINNTLVRGTFENL